MEQILKLIYFVLNSSSDVTNITSRLYPVVAPENTSFPCVVYWVSGVSPSDTKSGASSVDNMFVTIDSYAANTATSSGYTVVSNLAGHIRTALDRLPSSTYNTITIDGAQFIDAEIGYDAESDVYVVSMDFKFRVNRLGASVPVNAVPPILSGIEIVGNTLSVTNGTWNVSGLTFTYQWLRNGIAIAGATNNTYILVNDDYNAVISCQVTADNEGVTATATSNETDPIGGIVPVITGLPTIAGTVQVGETLTATAASAMGVPTPSTTWQWQISDDGLTGWSDITGETANTYTILEADYDKYLRVIQTETNAEGSDTATSAATVQIAGTVPVISGVPTIAGTAEVGQTLTVTAASVTGIPTPSTTWQWQTSADGVGGWSDISGATSSTYTIQAGDENNYLRVEQTETNAEGIDDAFSVATSQVQFAYDPEYQAVLDYATTQGYSLPSAGQQDLQNQLVLDLKAAGVWNKLDSFAVFATDGDQDFALIDWKRVNASPQPAFVAYTRVNSPTFYTNQGYQGGTSPDYIETNFNCFTDGVNYQSNDGSIGVVIDTNHTFASQVYFGDTAGGINMRGGAGDYFQNVQIAFSNHQNGDLAYFTNDGIGNAVQVQNITDVATAPEVGTIQNMTMWVLYHRGWSTQPVGIKIAAFFIGSGIYAERTAFYNAMNDYKTAI